MRQDVHECRNGVMKPLVIASAAKMPKPRAGRWIAHMGNVYVKDKQSPFCSTAATSSSRPRAVQDDARRSSQGRLFRAAAQRLDLELSEHVIMLDRSGMTGAPRVGGSIRASHNPRICDLGFEPVRRSGLRARSNSHSVVARGELHQHSACGGQAREDEAILRCGFEAMQSIGSSTRIFRG